ncbi:MAG: hemolysin III family protein [Treponema sp.]|nr:hemolysin III family protein [Treponema sp.]
MTREDSVASRAVRHSTLKSLSAKKRERIRQIKQNYEKELREVNIQYAKDPERLRAKYAAGDYARSERARKRAEHQIELENRRVERESKERQFSVAEEITSSILQGLGAALSVAATAILVYRAVTYAPADVRPIYVSTFACSGGLMILMYIMSTLHHALVPAAAKEVFNRLTHAFIFLIIGSVYTSFTLTTLRGVNGWILFGIVWGASVLGIVLYSIWGSELEIINIVFYLIIGWAGVVLAKRLYHVLPPAGFGFLLSCGFTYSTACIFLMIKKIKFMHVIGNAVMLMGTVYFYIAMFFAVI